MFFASGDKKIFQAFVLKGTANERRKEEETLYVERSDIVREDGQSTIMQASITLKENRRKEREKIDITFLG